MLRGAAIALQCTRCGSVSQREDSYFCPDCTGILDVKYDRPLLTSEQERTFAPSNRAGVWKYFDLLPIEDEKNIVSLDEGNTPLIKTDSFGHGIYVKDETRNPTGSFKDRPNTVGISKAVELGAKTIALASSGNAAGSLSAYAAKAKLQCVVCVPEDTPISKMNQILVFGAKVARVRGTYSDAFNLIRESCKKFGWHNLSSVCSANPYQVEGDKTVAYEIYEQFKCDIPDWVVIPLGAGPLLVGIWKGFKEMLDAGWIKSLPKLVGVQAEGCSPIVRAFKNGDKKVSPWEEKPDTIAHSIADPLTGYAQDGTLTLDKIRDSGGLAESVSDSQIIDSLQLLARTEGIFSEPAGAASVAALTKLKMRGTIGKEDKVVLVVTGTGLKSSEVLKGFGQVEIIDADPSSLRAVVSAED